MIQHSVLDKVREFYCPELRSGVTVATQEQQRYEQQVLSLAPKRKFRASLLWLVQSDAITKIRPTALTTSTRTDTRSPTNSSST
jgi:hypothetical protein